MTTIAGSTITVTLSPTTPDVTLTATIDAIAVIGTYDLRIGATVLPEPISAAVFGPKTGHFTVLNTGTVISPGNGLDFGILLGAAGTVINAGLIAAGNGIGILGGFGAQVENTGTIDATFDTGIYLQAAGTVTNKSVIDAVSSGILLGNGGFATNASTGHIYSNTLNGIDSLAKATIANAGTISGYETGIHLDLAGSIKNTGLIAERDLAATVGAYAAIYAGDGSNIDNAGGTLAGGNGIVIAGVNGRASITNTGTILALSTIDNTANSGDGFLNFGVGIYTATAADITNTGTIAATHVGIVVENALATVTNAGLIAAQFGYGAYLRGGGTLTNTGTIAGYSQGVFLNNSAATASGYISNAGLISAPAKSETLNGYFGQITTTSTAIFQLGRGTVQNLAGGTITAAHGAGIILDSFYQNFTTGVSEVLSGAITNAGTIDAVYGAALNGIGAILNSGKILAVNFGAESQYALAEVTNTGFIDVTGSIFSYTALVPAGTSFAYVTLTATAAGIVATKSGTITNAGTILAAAGTGISLHDGGLAENTGLITAYRDGIAAGYSAAATIINTGIITATGTTFTNDAGSLAISHGVLLKGGGIVTNAATGTITGQTGIAVIGTASAYIYNAGHVTATGHAGISLYPAGTVTNAKTGTIDAAHSGVELDAGGAVYNYGLIIAGKSGIYLKSGGAAYNYGTITAAAAGIYALAGAAAIYNDSAGKIFAANGIDLKTPGIIDNAGYISAANTGIVIQGGGTVTDTGTIIGGTGGAITFNNANAAHNLLILSPTARTTGIVNGGSGALELEADGKTIGTSAPAQFVNFDSVTIDSHAIWDMAGTFVTSLGLTLVNDGTIHESATDLITITGALTGTGTLDLSKKIFSLDGAVAATQKIAFTGTNETLALGDPTAFKGTIETFKSGDTIDLSTIPLSAITGTHFAGGILTLSESGTALKLTFASPATFKHETFALFADAAGTGAAGTGIKLVAAAAIPQSAPPTAPAWLRPEITSTMALALPQITLS